MTGENMKLDSLAKKLQNICDENALTYRFRRHEYPISLTILPTGGVDAQMTMLDNADDTSYISPDARIVFEYKDGTLIYHLSESFTISDALFAKVKNLFKNMLFLWLLQFNREVITQQLLTPEQTKIIVGADDNSDDGNDENAGDAEAADDLTVDDALPDFSESGEGDESAGNGEAPDSADDEQDELVRQAAGIVREAGSATISLLQKKLSIGYTKASRIMNKLEQLGVVGPYDGSGAREVFPDDSAGDGGYDYDAPTPDEGEAE